MKFLFFDTETTGLWKFNVSDDDPIQPDVVQLASVLMEDRKVISTLCLPIFLRIDAVVDPKATEVHGWTEERLKLFGHPHSKVFETFNYMYNMADTVVAHNLNFDRKLVSSGLRKAGYNYVAKPSICTMLGSTDYCKIPGPKGNKWPKLRELHLKLFGEEFSGAHDALDDVRATIRCFWKLIDLGVIKL